MSGEPFVVLRGTGHASASRTVGQWLDTTPHNAPDRHNPPQTALFTVMGGVLFSLRETPASCAIDGNAAVVAQILARSPH